MGRMRHGIYAAKYRRGSPVERRRADRDRMWSRCIRFAHRLPMLDFLCCPWSH